ncbi:ubiquitin carboxyl-terminal hydrolase 47-like [Micropterus dolomieu]|uniref:ubiquitin carboxyl-terminal hydrolase 47-like n=1 Tax=Micropterus dolomieu TaxID=147949 RepID=UPI001E8CE5AB|nr:ubiquitin carboxyl-terminal hydrolase 47-like [Micropterus dolomieu]
MNKLEETSEKEERVPLQTSERHRDESTKPEKEEQTDAASAEQQRCCPSVIPLLLNLIYQIFNRERPTGQDETSNKLVQDEGKHTEVEEEDEDEEKREMGHSDVVIWPQKVHDGLSNQGGTCSLNSDQQVFSMTPEVHERECPTDPEGQTDDAAERQDESSNKLVQDEGKHTEVEEEDEDEEKREMGHSDVVTRPQKCYYGLYNQGSTCYLNSILQVLFMTPEVHNRLDPEIQTDLQLRNIFEGLKMKTCGTETITKTLGIADVYQQCDAAECLEWILDKVSPQVSEEKGFQRIFDSKSFSGGNKVFCNECKKETEATRECEMVKFPQTLILLLKRFDIDYNTMSHIKSDLSVDVPPSLQIKNKTYKLNGMVNHVGQLRFGHYTAIILSNEDNTWYEFNDTNVKKAEGQPFAKKTYSSQTAYLLVYRAL